MLVLRQVIKFKKRLDKLVWVWLFVFFIQGRTEKGGRGETGKGGANIKKIPGGDNPPPCTSMSPLDDNI